MQRSWGIQQTHAADIRWWTAIWRSWSIVVKAPPTYPFCLRMTMRIIQAASGLAFAGAGLCTVLWFGRRSAHARSRTIPCNDGISVKDFINKYIFSIRTWLLMYWISFSSENQKRGTKGSFAPLALMNLQCWANKSDRYRKRNQGTYAKINPPCCSTWKPY